MSVIVVANKRVEVVSGKQTWLGIIHKGNVAGKRVMPNSFFNAVFLGTDDEGNFKPIPDKVLNARPLYTGTFGMVGAKGKPLGDKVEVECEYAGSKKTVVVKPDRDQAALVDTMVTCDHGFAADGTPLIPLINARTEKPIRNNSEMGEADIVLLRLNGQTQRYNIQSRDGGMLEAVGDEYTFGWVSDSAIIGLLRRGEDASNIDNRRRYVNLDFTPSNICGVVIESLEFPVSRFVVPIGPKTK